MHMFDDCQAGLASKNAVALSRCLLTILLQERFQHCVMKAEQASSAAHTREAARNDGMRISPVFKKALCA